MVAFLDYFVNFTYLKIGRNGADLIPGGQRFACGSGRKFECARHQLRRRILGFLILFALILEGFNHILEVILGNGRFILLFPEEEFAESVAYPGKDRRKGCKHLHKDIQRPPDAHCLPFAAGFGMTLREHFRYEKYDNCGNDR